MNHGVVMFQGSERPELRIWEMAMGRGQFVALYTGRRMERSSDGSPWRALVVRAVPTSGEPPRFSRFPDLARNETEYARYEPAYDGEFLEMRHWCGRCSAVPTVVVPATARDAEVMRLLGEMASIQDGAWRYLYERFYVVPRRNLRRPERSKIRLSTSHDVDPSRWRVGAYFLGFFRGGDGVVVFLSDDESDVEGLFESTDAGRPIIGQADRLHHHGVIEKW